MLSLFKYRCRDYNIHTIKNIMTYIFIYALVLGAASHDVDGFLECNFRNADVGLALIEAVLRKGSHTGYYILHISSTRGASVQPNPLNRQ